MTTDHGQTPAGVVDGAALDVLRRAVRTGYVLVGRHDRVARRDPTTRYRGLVELSRHEHDTVHALLVAGLLRLDGTSVVDDHGTDRRGHQLVLTGHGHRALHAADTADTADAADAGGPR
jgi:hypothetical protein